MHEKIRYTRKDLKSPDEFITTFGRVVAWGKGNRLLVLGSGLALAALVALVLGTRAYFQWKENKAARELWPFLNQAGELMQAPYNADPATVAALEKTLQARIDAYPDTRATVYARYYMGGLAFLRGDYDLSIKQYRAALAGGKDPGVMKYLLREGLARSLEAKGDYTGAAAAYRDAAAIGEADMKAQSRLGEARTLDLAGKKAEAVALYNQVLRESPESRWRELIRIRLAQMGG